MNNQEKINRILHLISNNETKRKYFFQRLTKAKNPSEWLLPLKERGYLNPSNNPKPIAVKEPKGYNIPHWEILDFLLKVAQKNNINPNVGITQELVSFIDSIIEYNRNIERVDNYRTDWMLLRIIFLLPFNEIKLQYIYYIYTALDSKWDNTLIVDVIKEEIIPILIEKHPSIS